MIQEELENLKEEILAKLEDDKRVINWLKENEPSFHETILQLASNLEEIDLMRSFIIKNNLCEDFDKYVSERLEKEESQ